MLVRDFKQDKPLALKQTRIVAKLSISHLLRSIKFNRMGIRNSQIYATTSMELNWYKVKTSYEFNHQHHLETLPTSEEEWCVCDTLQRWVDGMGKHERGADEFKSIFKIKFNAIEQFAKPISMSQLLWESFICVCMHGDKKFPFNFVQLVFAVISTFHWFQFTYKRMYSHHFLCIDSFIRKCISTSWRFPRMSIDKEEG